MLGGARYARALAVLRQQREDGGGGGGGGGVCGHGGAAWKVEGGAGGSGPGQGSVHWHAVESFGDLFTGHPGLAPYGDAFERAGFDAAMVASLSLTEIREALSPCTPSPTMAECVKIRMLVAQPYRLREVLSKTDAQRWYFPWSWLWGSEGDGEVLRMNLNMTRESVLIVNALLATFAGAGFFDPLPCARLANPTPCQGIERTDLPLWATAFLLHMWTTTLVILAMGATMIHNKEDMVRAQMSRHGWTVAIFPFALGSVGQIILSMAIIIRSHASLASETAWAITGVSILMMLVTCCYYVAAFWQPFHQAILAPAKISGVCTQMVCFTFASAGIFVPCCLGNAVPPSMRAPHGHGHGHGHGRGHGHDHGHDHGTGRAYGGRADPALTSIV